MSDFFYSLMIKHTYATHKDARKTFLLMRSIQDLLPKLCKKFPGISITLVNKRHKWGIINYSRENHRDPIIHYIQRHVTKKIVIKQKNINKI